MIYYFLFFLLSVFSFIQQLKSVNVNVNILKYISFGLILFIGGFRFEVGAGLVFL